MGLPSDKITAQIYIHIPRFAPRRVAARRMHLISDIANAAARVVFLNYAAYSAFTLARRRDKQCVAPLHCNKLSATRIHTCICTLWGNQKAKDERRCMYICIYARSHRINFANRRAIRAEHATPLYNDDQIDRDKVALRCRARFPVHR